MTDVLNNTESSFAIDVEKLAASLSTIPVGVKLLTDTAILPAFATAGAACFDLHADLKSEDDCDQINFYNEYIFRTGLAFDIPKGYALMVYSRSGHGFKNDVRLANCVGVIDSDYTGEVKVKLTIDHDGSFTVSHGDRIAQAMLIKVPCVQLVEVDELKTTERGANGFGSTGTSANVVTAEEEAATHPIMTSRHLDKK
ncbi:dTUPase [Escherichia phage VogelGryff]|nr:dTUPase [Escherichia phage VogelGryff]